MKISRRAFIKATSILGGGILLNGNKLLTAKAEEAWKLTNIRDNIWTFTEQGGTIGILVDKDALIVVDAQFPNTAKDMLTEVKKKVDRKIDILFNTHHHADHTKGNLYLKDYAEKIVAHENCVRLQKTSYGNDEKNPQVYADITFSKNWSANVGKEQVFAYRYGNAHTGGDAVFHFVNSNVVHVGDLVFNGVYPWIGGLKDESSLLTWAKYLEDIADKFSEDTIYIFGHGTAVTGNKKDLYVMRDYIVSLHDFTSKQIKAGKSLDEILKSETFPGAENRKAMWKDALKANLNAAYEIITNEG
ncbi:MBL fold metallo-hydrolase [Melioribacteraceae bacterium 4301-Me]|uniref:MBL fold metallo-hydrolase n=1 Tax=Pyranulibacter aquaticus TaxID=3163344 RepID=UPI00359C0DBC